MTCDFIDLKLDCGHTVASSMYVKGYVILHGKTTCHSCYQGWWLANLAAGNKGYAYLSKDGTMLESFNGAKLGMIERTTRAMWGRNFVTSWRGRLADGRQAYGKGGGKGLITTVKLRRSK